MCISTHLIGEIWAVALLALVRLYSCFYYAPRSRVTEKTIHTRLLTDEMTEVSLRLQPYLGGVFTEPVDPLRDNLVPVRASHACLAVYCSPG